METTRSDNKSDCTDVEPQQASPTWRGIHMVHWRSFWFTPVHLQATQEMITRFKPLPSDIILTSFPKTGTTWLKALLYSITYRSSPNHFLLTTHNPHMLVPSLELQVYVPDPQDLTSFPSCTMSSYNTRLFATHAPYQILDDNVYSSNCRVVYVTRNPKDTIVSYWQFMNKTLKDDVEQMTLEQMADRFCDGTPVYGPYYDHVLGYWRKSLDRPDKVFFVTYEELQDDPTTHIKRLGEFMGCPFKTDTEAEEIVQSCSIERLTKHEVNKSSADILKWMKTPHNAFFREGKVGDYINYMSPEMIERIDSITKQKFHASGFRYGL